MRDKAQMQMRRCQMFRRGAYFFGEMKREEFAEQTDRIAATGDERFGADLGALEGWPAPEGLAPKPDASALTEFLIEARARLAGDADLSRAQILGLAAFVNRVGLHICSQYCLRDGVCRMGFGEEDKDPANPAHTRGRWACRPGPRQR